MKKLERSDFFGEISVESFLKHFPNVTLEWLNQTEHDREDEAPENVAMSFVRVTPDPEVGTGLGRYLTPKQRQLTEVILDEARSLLLGQRYVDDWFLGENRREAIRKEILNQGPISVKIVRDQISKILGELFEESYLVSKDIVDVTNEFKSRGLNTIVLTSSTLEEMLTSFVTHKPIEGIDLSSKIKDPAIRFVTTDNPKLSAMISEAFSMLYHGAKTLNEEVQEMGREKLRENADDFAVRMYDVVAKIQGDENISSFRATVESLNNHKIPSYRGGEWHLNTYQNLVKRWKALGLLKE